MADQSLSDQARAVIRCPQCQGDSAPAGVVIQQQTLVTIVTAEDTRTTVALTEPDADCSVTLIYRCDGGHRFAHNVTSSAGKSDLVLIDDGADFRPEWNVHGRLGG